MGVQMYYFTKSTVYNFFDCVLPSYDKGLYKLAFKFRKDCCG